MDHLDLDLALSVGEGTELLVIAAGGLVGVCLAELSLVAAGVVDLLDLVVGEAALLVFAAAVRTELMAIFSQVLPPAVEFVVEVDAGLALVVVAAGTLFGLMGLDIEPEKLTVFEVSLVLVVQVGAKQLVRAVVEIVAALGFVVGRVVQVLGFVEAQKHVRWSLFCVGQALLQRRHVREVGEGML